jgi:hypothetical protein
LAFPGDMTAQASIIDGDTFEIYRTRMLAHPTRFKRVTFAVVITATF